MKTRLLQISVLLCICSFAFGLSGALSAAAEAPASSRKKIYDESLDGNKQIAEALALAKKGNKRVLLQFGANWCGWCHKLHELFATDADIKAKLKSDYVVVLVDVNEDHNSEVDKKYGNPMRFGLPAIVILDAEGKQLTTKDSGELEEGDHHDPAKVLAFLKEWGAKK